MHYSLPQYKMINAFFLQGIGNSTESSPLMYDDEIWKIRMREVSLVCIRK